MHGMYLKVGVYNNVYKKSLRADVIAMVKQNYSL